MKKTARTTLIGLVAAAAVNCAAESTNNIAATRALVKEHAQSAVAVEVRFKTPDGEESVGFNIPYLCPNCSRTHYNSLSDYVKEDKPLVMAGYVVGPDRVMVQDISVRSNFVDSVEVDFEGRRYKTVPVRRYPEQRALELKTERPIEGARPIAFTGGNVSAEKARFFFHAKEDGLFVSGFLPGDAVKFRHYAGIGKDIAPMPANVIVLDAENRPVSLSFTTPVVLGETGFTAPGTWKGEEPYAFDARLDAMQKKVFASLVPVYIHREEEKRSSGRSRISIRMRGDDDGKGLDIDVAGYALPNGELLLPLNLDATMTAEIDKIEAVMPDGSRTPLEYVGAFDKYALAIVRFTGGKHPAGVAPMRIYRGGAESLMLRRLYTVSVRSMDGVLSGEILPERAVKFETVRGGDTVPDVRLDTQNGRQAFAVTEDGELVLGTFKRRNGREWSSGTIVSAASLAALLGERKFNSEYAIRKGKDRIRAAWIGVETQPMTADLAREKKSAGFLKAFRTDGALVGRVFPGTPAEKAGIRPGDVLLYARREGENDRTALEAGSRFGGSFDLSDLIERLDGSRLEIFDADDFAPWPDVEKGVNEVFTGFGIGAVVEVGYVSDGKKKEAKLTLAQIPVHFRNAKRFKSKALGAAFADLTFEVRGFFKLADDAPGVVVSKVKPGDPAAVAGLRPLEVVTHVDDKPVADVKALREAINGKSEFNLSVRRLAATRIVRVKMAAGDSDAK